MKDFITAEERLYYPNESLKEKIVGWLILVGFVFLSLLAITN